MNISTLLSRFGFFSFLLLVHNPVLSNDDDYDMWVMHACLFLYTFCVVLNFVCCGGFSSFHNVSYLAVQLNFVWSVLLDSEYYECVLLYFVKVFGFKAVPR